MKSAGYGPHNYKTLAVQSWTFVTDMYVPRRASSYEFWFKPAMLIDIERLMTPPDDKTPFFPVRCFAVAVSMPDQDLFTAIFEPYQKLNSIPSDLALAAIKGELEWHLQRRRRIPAASSFRALADLSGHAFRFPSNGSKEEFERYSADREAHRRASIASCPQSLDREERILWTEWFISAAAPYPFLWILFSSDQQVRAPVPWNTRTESLMRYAPRLTADMYVKHAAELEPRVRMRMLSRMAACLFTKVEPHTLADQTAWIEAIRRYANLAELGDIAQLAAPELVPIPEDYADAMLKKYIWYRLRTITALDAISARLFENYIDKRGHWNACVD